MAVQHTYAVRCNSEEDLQDFYNDMETEGGSITIPNRVVDVAERRPSSRTTFYSLTPDEAKLVRNDPRVNYVEWVNPTVTEQPCVNYYRRSAANSTDRQWGLYQHTQETPDPTYGVNVNKNVPDITYPYTGRNVDVVIYDDDGWEPNHPEFLDENGNNRIVQYNWFQHNPEVTGGAAGNYVYGTSNGAYHNIHCAGTAVGLNEGWAKDANLYFLALDFGSTGQMSKVSSSLGFDYIRAFHNAKPINPETGFKNPTIVNCSWGSFRYAAAANRITSINFGGQIKLPGGGEPITEFTGLYGPYSTTSKLTDNPVDPEDATSSFTIAINSVFPEATSVHIVAAANDHTGVKTNEHVNVK